MARKGALRILAGLAADQAGLVTAAQAVEAGVPRPSLSRLVTNGRLEQVARGVYLVEGSQAPDHLPIRAAWLRLDPGAPAWRRDGLGPEDGVVSHRSATVLLDVGDIPADNVELSVPKRRTTREPGVRLLVRPDMPASDVTSVAGLPVTTAERTIVDLLRDRADGGHVGTVIADSVKRGLVDVDTLAERVDGLAAGYGMADASGRELISTLVEQADRQLEPDRVRDVAETAALLAYSAGAEGAWRHLAADLAADLAVSGDVGTELVQVKHSPLSDLAVRWAQRSAVSDAALRAVAHAPNREVLDALCKQTSMWESVAKHIVAPAVVTDAVQASTFLHSVLGANPAVLDTWLETSRTLTEHMHGPFRQAAALSALLRASAPPPDTLAALTALATVHDDEAVRPDQVDSTEPTAADQRPDQDGDSPAYRQGLADATRDAKTGNTRTTAPHRVPQEVE